MPVQKIGQGLTRGQTNQHAVATHHPVTHQLGGIVMAATAMGAKFRTTSHLSGQHVGQGGNLSGGIAAIMADEKIIQLLPAGPTKDDAVAQVQRLTGEISGMTMAAAALPIP